MHLDALHPNPHNPRTIQGAAFARLKTSIQRDPQFMALRPIVYDQDRMILGGNMRYRACQELGMTEIPDAWAVCAADLSEEQKRRFILVDNSPEGIAGEWDTALLAAEWEIPELEDLGFNLADLSAYNSKPDEVADFDFGREIPGTEGQSRINLVLPEDKLAEFEPKLRAWCEAYDYVKVVRYA